LSKIVGREWNTTAAFEQFGCGDVFYCEGDTVEGCSAYESRQYSDKVKASVEAVTNVTKIKDDADKKCDGVTNLTATASEPPQPEYQGYESERTPDMTDEQLGRWIAANCALLEAEDARCAREEEERRAEERREGSLRFYESVKAKRNAKVKPVKRTSGDCAF
jgi:hypothetical protein